MNPENKKEIAGGCCGVGGSSSCCKPEPLAKKKTPNSNDCCGNSKEESAAAAAAASCCAGGGGEGSRSSGCCQTTPQQKSDEKPLASSAASESCTTSKQKEEEGACCRHSHPKEEQDQGQKLKNHQPLCVAVVQENGTDMSLFDASGMVKKFSLSIRSASRLSQDDQSSEAKKKKNNQSERSDDQTNNNALDIRDLCFSSHGKHSDDSLLTPCLDADGNHKSAEQDVDCFCGVSTPHLHAHVKDPKVCGGENHHDHHDDKSDNNQEDIARLTTLTLHAHQEEGEATDERIFHIPVSDHMPKVCNSKELSKHLNSKSSSNSSCCQSGTCTSEKSISNAPVVRSTLRQEHRRLHKVQHDDHVDYLVHNPLTGDLHLEHADCDTCGASDIHGKFTLVGTRHLDRSQLHFFHPSTQKFRLRNLFEPESSGRVAAIKPICCANGSCSAYGCCTTVMSSDETTVATHHDHSHSELEDPMLPSNSTIVRSKFYCAGICCSSEVPLIHSSLEDLDGVVKILINFPLRHVMVDYDAAMISATILESILNQNGFGASLLQDGGAVAASSAVKPTVGKSRFYVDRICCASEIPAINAIVTPLAGVTKVSINVTTKMVYVEHDPATVSAQAICDALNADHFGAHIEFDAATAVVSSSACVTSIFDLHVSEEENEAAGSLQLLQDYLKSIDSSSIEAFVVDEPSRKLTVIHNHLLLPADKIASDVSEKAKIQVVVSRDGAQHQVWDFQPVNGSENENEESLEASSARLRPTVAISGVLWIVSMLSLIGGNWEYLKYVALISIAFGLPPIAMKAFRTMRRLQFDANCLMLFAALGAVALQEIAEAAAVTFLFAFSEWLEVRATSRARHALSAIVKLRPESANLVHPNTGEIIKVSASTVPIGALVVVRTGDKIPCDGVVVEGNSTVDESSLTGESRPVRKGLKDPVSGGTINSGATQMKVRTTVTADDSAVARLIRLVEEAQANRSETEQLVDEFARVYTPVIVLCAVLMCSIPWIWGREIGREWTNNGLVLIVVACPCALIISTPVTYVAALANLAARGILVKGGKYLEALGQVRKICFDKTGTLTEGKFQLLHLDMLTNTLDRRQILEYLYIMEEGASHPLAQAIVDAIRNEGVEKPRDIFVKDHSFIPGEGVVGTVGASRIYVGNFRMFERLGLLESLESSILERVHGWEESLGATIGFMSHAEHGILCCYAVCDAVREEAMPVVKDLGNRNIVVAMLTGDNSEAAAAIGKQVGLVGEEIRSDLLPEEKLRLVSEMKDSSSSNRSALLNLFSSRSLVLMCGDGVNDGPALAAADLSVAMGGGAALALETADITLLDSNLTKLVYSLDMGRRVIRKIVENVTFSISVKFLVLGFALAGKAHLFAAIASDVGAMILVTLNSMLLLPSRHKSAFTTSNGDSTGKLTTENSVNPAGSSSESEEKGV